MMSTAQTTIGLYKHECVRADSPLRTGRWIGLVISR